MSILTVDEMIENSQERIDTRKKRDADEVENNKRRCRDFFFALQENFIICLRDTFLFEEHEFINYQKTLILRAQITVEQEPRFIYLVINVDESSGKVVIMVSREPCFSLNVINLYRQEDLEDWLRHERINVQTEHEQVRQRYADLSIFSGVQVKQLKDKLPRYNHWMTQKEIEDYTKSLDKEISRIDAFEAEAKMAAEQARGETARRAIETAQQSEKRRALKLFIEETLTTRFFIPYKLYRFSYVPDCPVLYDEEGETVPIKDSCLSFISDKDHPDEGGYFDKLVGPQYTKSVKLRVLGHLCDVEIIDIDTIEKLRNSTFKNFLVGQKPHSYIQVSVPPLGHIKYDLDAEIDKLLPEFEDRWKSLKTK